MDSSQSAVDATARLVEILGGLDSEQRKRVVSAALVLLGESNHGHHKVPEPNPDEHVNGLSPKATAWAKKHGISTDQLEHVFTIEPGDIDVIASRAPGKSKRLQTIESYVLCGLKSFLATGDHSFTDDDARAVCKKLGAFDSPNHFNYVKGLGNFVTGSKDSGWKLTNPGLARAAEIVKLLAPIKVD